MNAGEAEEKEGTMEGRRDGGACGKHDVVRGWSGEAQVVKQVVKERVVMVTRRRGRSKEV